MEKVKGLLAVLFCVCALASTVACSKAPGDVAVKFLEGLRDGNTPMLADNCTPEFAEEMTELVRHSKEDEARWKRAWEDVSFKVVKTEIDGERAVVDIELSKKGETEVDLETYILRKIDGTWKVCEKAW